MGPGQAVQRLDV